MTYRSVGNSRAVALKSPPRQGPQLVKVASLMPPVQPAVGSMILPVDCCFCILGVGPCDSSSLSFLNCLSFPLSSGKIISVGRK